MASQVHFVLWGLEDAEVFEEVDHDDGDAVRSVAESSASLVFSFRASKAPGDLNMDGLFTHSWISEAALESGAEIGFLDSDEVEDSLEILEDLIADPRSTLPSVGWVKARHHAAIAEGLSEANADTFAHEHAMSEVDPEQLTPRDAVAVSSPVKLVVHAVLAFVCGLREASGHDNGTIVFYCDDPNR